MHVRLMYDHADCDCLILNDKHYTFTLLDQIVVSLVQFINLQVPKCYPIRAQVVGPKLHQVVTVKCIHSADCTLDGEGSYITRPFNECVCSWVSNVNIRVGFGSYVQRLTFGETFPVSQSVGMAVVVSTRKTFGALTQLNPGKRCCCDEGGNGKNPSRNYPFASYQLLGSVH